MKVQKMMKAFVALAVVALVVPVMTACGSSKSASKANDGVITAYNSEPENGLIPGDTTEVGGGNPLDLMFAGLVAYKSDGSYVPEVAESIETTDNQHFTVKLKDWKWSDGSTLTAADFVDTWNFTANAKNAQKCMSFYDVIKGYDKIGDSADPEKLTGEETLEGLKLVDDKTFTIELAQPSATFVLRLGNSAYFPVPSKALKNIKEFGENPVSNGAYKLAKWEHQQSISLVPNENYQGTAPAKNKGVTFKVYTNPDAGYTAVQSGELNVMDTIPTSQVKTFKTDASIQGHSDESPLIEEFAVPSYLPHFAGEEGNLRRQAISMSIDRQLIIDTVLNGTATPGVAFTSTMEAINGGKESKDVPGNEAMKFNPEKAKELWAKADALSKWDGVFKISFNADGGGNALYEAVTNQIKNTLGIDAQADAVVDFKTLRKDANAGTLKYALRNGWQPDYPSVENYLQPIFYSGGSSNDARYESKVFDELLAKGSSAATLDEANKYFVDAQAQLMKDMPEIVMYTRNVNTACSKDVQGYTLTWKGVPDYRNITKG